MEVFSLLLTNLRMHKKLSGNSTLPESMARILYSVWVRVPVTTATMSITTAAMKFSVEIKSKAK